METISKLRRRFLILAGLNLTIFIVSFIILRNWGINRLETELQTLTRGYTHALHLRLETDMDVLQAAAYYLSGPREVDTQQLQVADNALMARHPDIEAVTWIPNPLLNSATTAIKPALPLHGGKPQNAVTTFDALLSSHDSHLLERAWQTGKPQAAPPDKNIQPGDRASFHVFVPVYNDKAPVKKHELKSLKGFLIATINLDEMTDAALSKTDIALSKAEPVDVTLAIYDGTLAQNDRLLITYRTGADEKKTFSHLPNLELPLALEWGTTIKAADRTWLLVCKPADSEFASSRMWTGRIVVFSGFLGSLVLAGILFIAINRTMRFETLVVQRTDELQQEVKEREQAEARWREAAATLEESNRELERLNELSELLQTCHSMEEAAKSVSLLAGELFEGTYGAICFYDAETSKLKSVANWGGQRAIEIEPDSCRAMRAKRPYIFSPDKNEPCGHLEHINANESYCVPLLAQERILGLLTVSALPGGDPLATKQRFIQTVAEQLAPALGKLALQKDLRELSIRDSLTDLFNRRYLEETLARETSRALRTGRPLSIIMIDLDHFKRFNDRYGHHVGDLLLQCLGALLITNIRREDVACRYGGEEFTLILPEANLEQACARAEIMRAAAEKLRLEEAPGEAITISMGVSSMPDHGNGAEVLLRAADAALYEAKSRGRNRVETAGARSGQTERVNVVPQNPPPFKELSTERGPFGTED